MCAVESVAMIFNEQQAPFNGWFDFVEILFSTLFQADILKQHIRMSARNMESDSASLCRVFWKDLRIWLFW